MNGIVSQCGEVGIRSPNRILDEICEKLKNNSTVLLIDEYDAPLTHHMNKPDELGEIISILNDFYATIKQYTDKFRLIFITGITKASHVSIFSALNNLVDLSLDSEFNNLLGFTNSEINKYFDLYVENAATILQMSKNDLYTRLEQYYDGFQFSFAAEQTLYNPWSILNFFKNPKKGFYNYWFKSGGKTAIIINYLKIKDSFDFINYKDRDIIVDEDELSDIYEIDKITPHILLYQAGYFTIRNNTDCTSSLVIPNGEVEESLFRLSKGILSSSLFTFN